MKFGGRRVFRVDYFILPLFLVPKLSSVAQNEWEKHPYIFLVKIKLLNGFFFTHFVPLISILAPKIMEE